MAGGGLLCRIRARRGSRVVFARNACCFCPDDWKSIQVHLHAFCAFLYTFAISCIICPDAFLSIHQHAQAFVPGCICARSLHLCAFFGCAYKCIFRDSFSRIRNAFSTECIHYRLHSIQFQCMASRTAFCTHCILDLVHSDCILSSMHADRSA